MKKYSGNFCNYFELSGGISFCHSNASRSIVVQGDPAFSLAKGQLISKCLFGIFNSPKKRTKIIRLQVP